MSHAIKGFFMIFPFFHAHCQTNCLSECVVFLNVWVTFNEDVLMHIGLVCCLCLIAHMLYVCKSDLYHFAVPFLVSSHSMLPRFSSLDSSFRLDFYYYYCI